MLKRSSLPANISTACSLVAMIITASGEKDMFGFAAYLVCLFLAAALVLINTETH